MRNLQQCRVHAASHPPCFQSRHIAVPRRQHSWISSAIVTHQNRNHHLRHRPSPGTAHFLWWPAERLDGNQNCWAKRITRSADVRLRDHESIADHQPTESSKSEWYPESAWAEHRFEDAGTRWKVHNWFSVCILSPNTDDAFCWPYSCGRHPFSGDWATVYSSIDDANSIWGSALWNHNDPNTDTSWFESLCVQPNSRSLDWDPRIDWMKYAAHFLWQNAFFRPRLHRITRDMCSSMSKPIQSHSVYKKRIRECTASFDVAPITSWTTRRNVERISSKQKQSASTLRPFRR